MPHLDDAQGFSIISQKSFAIGSKHIASGNIQQAQTFDKFSDLCWEQAVDCLCKAINAGEFKD